MSFLDTSCPWSHLRTGKFSPFIIFHNLSSSRLNLMRTSKRIDIIMKCFFVKNKTLKILTSKNISSDDFIILTRNATNLRTLDTSGCSWMSYDLLKPVLKNNQKLRELDLSYFTRQNSSYTDSHLNSTCSFSHSYTYLNSTDSYLRSYSHFLKNLKVICPQFRRFTIHDCPQKTKLDLRLKQLKHPYLKGCTTADFLFNVQTNRATRVIRYVRLGNPYI